MGADPIRSIVGLAASMRNIELKARDPQPGRTLELALAAGAEDQGELAQRDTYFARARGRLKLREEAGAAELIQYRRADMPDARESEYRRIPAADPAALREALDAALGTLVVVEAVAAPGSDLAAERDKVERLRAALEIAEDRLVAQSYSDLLLDTTDLLLRAADAAMRNAHAPYSRFKVGAALRAPSGAVYSGANVENAAYPQGQCAEASAIGALVAAGEREIAAAAVVARPVEIGYEELPGFPRPTVEGHGGRAVLGRVGDVPVAILQGRAHLYEGVDH